MIWKNKKAELISWTMLLILSVLLYFAATDFFVFPVKLKMPMLLVSSSIVCICGFFSFFANNKSKIIVCTINELFIVLMLCALVFLPFFEKQVRCIFKETKTAEAVINVYALNDDERSKLEEFKGAIYAIQHSLDLDNQGYAIEEIKNALGLKNLETMICDDVVSAAKALYEKQSDLLILNEVYVDLLKEIEGFEKFSEKTKVIYSVAKEIVSEAENLLPLRTDITDTPFTVYIAGCDTISGRLTIYGRTDVNLLLCVNPNTKQILIISIPRDTYIPNPALNYDNDKLTHLGNNGIYNTIKGVSEYLNIEIDYFGEVIFDTFKRIIDVVGGIDVQNPYYFKASGIVNEKWRDFEYPVGIIHLNGDAALAYARERKSLTNGDYDRNEHQTYVLRAFINKVLSPNIIKSYDELFSVLKGQFMTDMNVEDLFKLANMQLNEGWKWDIISYHLGGIGDMCGTASMGWDRKLYVVHLFDSQVRFVKNQIDMIKKDQMIKQEILPQNDETTYIPN